MSIETPRYKRDNGEGDVPDNSTPPNGIKVEIKQLPSRPEYAPGNNPDTEPVGWFPRHRGALLTGVAATAAAAVAFGLVNANEGGRDNAVYTAVPTTSAPAVPGEYTPPLNEFKTNAEYYPSVYDTALYKQLTPDQQQIIRRAEEMSLTVFQKLPYEQQIVYADFYSNAYREYGMEQLVKSPYYKPETPDNVSIDSSGQDIMNVFGAHHAALWYSMTDDGRPHKINDTNREEVQKALSLLYPNQNSNLYWVKIDDIAKLDSMLADNKNPHNGHMYPAYQTGRESPVGIVDGVPTKYINIPQNGKQWQYIFTLNRYVNIRGENQEVWQLQMTLAEEDPRYIANVEGLFQQYSDNKNFKQGV